MRIIVCSKCGRLIHADKLCFFCGNTEGGSPASESAVHENAQNSFALAEMMLLQGQFDEAQQTIAEVMEWSANCSEVHWLRMLARARCRSDRELFFSGASLDENPDYETALRYAGEEEKTAYLTVGNACAAFRKTLVEMVNSRNSMVIEKLSLSEELNALRSFISQKRTSILSKWQELRKCEQELRLLENEGMYFVRECRRNMEDVCEAAGDIRGEFENISEIDRKQFFTQKVKLEGLKRAANTAKEEYYRLKEEHPSIAAFAELNEKRGEIAAAINSELSEIKEYEKKIEGIIAQINAAKQEGEALLESANAGKYEPIRAALGQANYERAARYALSLK